MAGDEDNRGAFLIQEHYCRVMDAPITGRLVASLARVLSRVSRTGARVLDWPGEPTRDAVPLRLIGGLHALHRGGGSPELSRVFSGAVIAPAEVDAILAATLVAHDAALLPWLDGPPQTNEPGRSAALMLGLIEVAGRHGPRLELLEIGSSAGLNLLIDRYRFDLGGTLYGPADAAVTIRPEWRGAAAAAVPLVITSVRGVDVAPVDVTDWAAATRLAAYVWVDTPMRLARLVDAIAMVAAAPVALDRGDAAEWLAARLAEPQAAGTTRVVMHSVVWQYLGDERRARITAMMAAAGERATAERPLAWVQMEPDRVQAWQEVRVRSWPDPRGWRIIAHAHAHGTWLEPLAGVDAGDDITSPAPYR